MIGNIRSGVRAFDDGATPPAAQVLTVAAVASPGGVMPPSDQGNVLRLWALLDGTAMDGLIITLTPARRGTISTVDIEPVRNSDGVAAGVETLSAGVYTLGFTVALTDVTVPIDIDIVPGYAYLVGVGRVGGDATSAALITADFIEK